MPDSSVYPLEGFSIEVASAATEVSAPRRPFRPLGIRRSGVSLGESDININSAATSLAVFISRCAEMMTLFPSLE